MLDPEERAQVVAALEDWADMAQNIPMLGFLGPESLMTPRQIVAEVKENTSQGQAILEILEHVVRREGMDRVTARLRQVANRN